MGQKRESEPTRTPSLEAAQTPSKPKFERIEAPKIELPKGGGTLKAISETFRVNLSNGTSTLSLPFPFETARGFGPQMTLAYDSGGGNGSFGLGWRADLPSISRSTARRLPTYDDAQDADIFQLTGFEDLVPAMRPAARGGLEPDTDTVGLYSIVRYRPRTEGSYARVERIRKAGEVCAFWRVMLGDGTVTIYGRTSSARIADPDRPDRIFRWLPEWSFDDKGNCFQMTYKPEDFAGVAHNPSEELRLTGQTRIANRYLKHILYGNRTPYSCPSGVQALDPPLPVIGFYFFQMVLDYGEHDRTVPTPDEVLPWVCRRDPFSNGRGGFDIRTYRLASRALFFNRFDEFTGHGQSPPWVLVRGLTFEYAHCNFVSRKAMISEADLLIGVRETGYRPDGAGGYGTTDLPMTRLTYQPSIPDPVVLRVDRKNLPSAPAGATSPLIPVDLYGEGLPGLLMEVGDNLYYQESLGGGAFSRANLVWSKPSLSGVGDGFLQVRDLESDGRKQLVVETSSIAGFFELGRDAVYCPFQPFLHPATIETRAPRRKIIDLNGDGKGDVAITEDDRLLWLAGAGRDGYGAWMSAPLPPGAGPSRMVFADEDEGVHLADMTGDGLVDVVRVRSDSIAYWPNLGFGTFGQMIEMDAAPLFDHPNLFDPRRVQFTDLSGTGAADVVYIGVRGPLLAINYAGNAWSDPVLVEGLSKATQPGDVTVMDLLGAGTPCLVMSSTLAADAGAPILYADLYNGLKPLILASIDNGAGKVTSLSYRSSAQYYLDDRAAGRNWVTKLPFPVQCVERVGIRDAVTNSLFVKTYAYRHGYFDKDDREFRGFAYVEEIDSESFNRMAGTGNAPAPDLHEDPVCKRTWFHTGAFPGRALVDALAPEFFTEPGLIVPFLATVVEETPSGRPTDRAESHRVLKGSKLREEVYGLDGSAKQPIPYSIEANSFRIRAIAPRGAHEFGVFQVLAAEAVQIHLERSLTDPRIHHSISLSFDDRGNVLESASIAYGRRTEPAGVPNRVFVDQQVSRIELSTTRYTGDVETACAHRHRQVCETTAYELAGFLPPSQFIDGRTLAAGFAGAIIVDFDGPLPSGVYRRLLWRQRTIYASGADITQPAPLFSQGAQGLVHESWELCFDATLRQALYGSDVVDADLVAVGYVKGSDLITAGVFPAAEQPGLWWRSSGHVEYAVTAAPTFYRPVAYVDPLGSRTTVREHRDYFLLIDQITDPLMNVLTATDIDFYVVKPSTVLDINRNLSSVCYDRLGLVAGSAVMGKGAEGDSLAGFSSDLTDAQIDDFFNDPMGQARALLGRATSRVVSDHRQVPNWSAVIGRATHDAEQTSTGILSPLQIAFDFWDGLGRLTLRKLLAEPGPALALSAGTQAVVTVDTTPNPRWVGSGRTVANNKGDPVLAFEPYFATTHVFSDWSTLAAAGQSVRQHYDPLGRATAIDHPDGSFERTAFDCWSRTNFDRNDTVLESSWYAARSGGALGAAQRDAATKTAVHDSTPSQAYFDALGHPIASIAQNRWIDAGTGLPVLEALATLNSRDIQGQVLQVTDPREIVIATYRYDMAGTKAVTEIADAGVRWQLANVMGLMAVAGDAKLNRLTIDYDVMHRPRAFHVQQGATPDRVLERQDYGTAADAGANANGRIKQTFDGGGRLANVAYDFQGNVLETVRTYLIDPTARPDWTTPAAVALGPEDLATSITYDALNRIVSLTSPDTTQEVFTYNDSNLVETVAVTLPGESEALFVEEISYTAKGQRVAIRFGNGTQTQYAYDVQTDRLATLRTTRIASGEALQALSYVYDPVGNVTSIADGVADSTYFNNIAVPGSGAYTYDALYRLINATGREHAAGDAPPDWTDGARLNLPSKADGSALQTYKECYAYDHSGNLTQIRHNGGRGSMSLRWTRSFSNSAAGNELLSAAVGASVDTFAYDVRGNLISAPHLSFLDWNEDDQLVEVHTPAGDRAYYSYDSKGQRVRKYIKHSDGTSEERVYVGRWERHLAKRNDGSVRVTRETLHILDGEKRLALVERRTSPSDDGPVRLIAYQYGNALGSALLELDESGTILSYEEYHPYGSTALQSVSTLRRTPAKRYRFTAKERDDETGFYYHGSRYMAPWLCRWISPDPADLADGGNTYAYAGNRPIGSSDPTGQWEWRSVAVVTAKIVVGVAVAAAAVAAAPVIAGAVVALGVTGAIATGAVVGAVTGAVGAGLTTAAGEVTRQVVNSSRLGLGSEKFSAGRVGAETYVAAKSGGKWGGVIGGLAASSAVAATIGGIGKVAQAVGQRVIPGFIRQGVSLYAQSAARSGAGRLLQHGVQGLGALGGRLAAAVFKEGSESARVATAMAGGASMAEAFGGALGASVVPAAKGASLFAEIGTPYGSALQSLAPEAIAARSAVEGGAPLYRLGTIGRSEAAEAQFWALEHPLNPGYAARYGIPAENVAKFDFIETATLKPGTSFVTRPAPGIGSNPGGGIEVVTPHRGVIMNYFGRQ